MPVIHLTDLSIRKLKQPEEGDVTYFDKDLRGFGIRCSPGAKTFVLLHGRRRRRLTIGRYPIISLAQAREKVKSILAERTLGTPITHSSTFDKELERFLAQHCLQNNRPSTAKETERLLRVHFLPKLEGRRLSEVTRPDISDVIDRLSKTPSEARHAFVALRTFLRWTVRRGALKHNPIEGMDAPSKPSSRTRVLSLEELAKVYQAGEGTIGEIIRLLILTGQRRGEIASLRGEYLDLSTKTITLPKTLTKNGREHLFPIGTRAVALLKGATDTGYLFPARGKDKPFNGWSKSKPKVDIPHWTLHDLRRSFSTHLAACGVQPHVTERLLNHAAGTLSEIAQTYNKYHYLDEMRSAVALWESKLSKYLRPDTLGRRTRPSGMREPSPIPHKPTSSS